MGAPPAVLGALEAGLAPLDWLRVRWIRLFGRLGAHLAGHRDARVATNGVLAVVVGAVGVVAAPGWWLALTPLLLGVPHLVADLRYLVVRPGLLARPALVAGVGGPLIAFAGTGDLPWGLLAVAGASLAARGSVGRRAVGVGAGLVAAGVAWKLGWVASLAMAHLHNLVALALWWAWRDRRGALHAVPVVAFAGVAGLLATGLVDPLAQASSAWLPPPEPGALAFLTRGIPDSLALRSLLLFGFAQSVHYTVWIRMVPDEDRPREAARTVRRQARELVGDLGVAGAAVAALVAVALIAGAFVDLGGARDGYLRLARFHGAMELAIAALWAVEGRPR